MVPAEAVHSSVALVCPGARSRTETAADRAGLSLDPPPPLLPQPPREIISQTHVDQVAHRAIRALTDESECIVR
jgi:hypothetical protein